MTKVKIKEKCRFILQEKYNIGDVISDEADKTFLLEIFSCHPDYSKKKGSGIDYISVKKTLYQDRCFYIHRTDGSSTDISYNKCINSPSKKSIINSACRNAIRSEITSYRDSNVEYGVSVCPFTNEILYEHNTHVDHYDMTFSEMFNSWISTKDIDTVYSFIADKQDNSMETSFKSFSYIIPEFIEFHNKHCKLRCISEKANMMLLRQSQSKKTL